MTCPPCRSVSLFDEEEAGHRSYCVSPFYQQRSMIKSKSRAQGCQVWDMVLPLPTGWCIADSFHALFSSSEDGKSYSTKLLGLLQGLDETSHVKYLTQCRYMPQNVIIILQIGDCIVQIGKQWGMETMIQRNNISLPLDTKNNTQGSFVCRQPSLIESWRALW